MENDQREEAYKLLESEGLAPRAGWHIEDVQNRFECSKEEALELLQIVLDSEHIVDAVYNAIRDEAEQQGYKDKDYE